MKTVLWLTVWLLVISPAALLGQDLVLPPQFQEVLEQEIEDQLDMRHLAAIDISKAFFLGEFAPGVATGLPPMAQAKYQDVLERLTDDQILFILATVDSMTYKRQRGFIAADDAREDAATMFGRAVYSKFDARVRGKRVIILDPLPYQPDRGIWCWIVTTEPEPRDRDTVIVREVPVPVIGDTPHSKLSLALGFGMKAVVTPGMNYWAPGVTAGASVGEMLVISGGAFYRPKSSSQFGQMADIIFSVSAELYPTKSWWGIKVAITGANDAIAPEFKFLRNTTGLSVGPTIRFGESLQVQADVCLQPSKYSQLKSTTDILKVGADAQLQLRLLF